MDITRWRADQQRLGLCSFSPAQGLAFLAGVLALYSLSGLPALFWCPPLLIVGLLSRRAHRRLGQICLFILLGFSLASLVATQRMEGKWPAERHGEDVWMHGYIQDIPLQKAGPWRFLFASDDQPGLIRVSWYAKDAAPQAGQCWDLKLRMRTPRGSMNPGGLDYEGWLFRNNISATAYVRDARPCGLSSHPVAILNAWRAEAIGKVEGALKGHPMHPVISALIFGDRSGFSTQDWSVLRRTGTSHLMAISGLHVGLVAAWAYLLGCFIWKAFCRYLPALREQQFGIVVSVLVAGGYTAISGFGLPAQRALIMLLALYVALWSGRHASAFGILTLALLGVLLIDPFAVGSAGFWLSFGAVAWILYFFHGRLQRAGKLSVLVWIQLLLGTVLLPICLFWFGEASLVSPLVNLILVPIFGLLIPLLMLNVSLLLLGLPGTEFTLLWMAECMELIWQILYQVDSVSPVVTQGLQPGILETGLCITGLIWLFMPRGWAVRPLGLFFCIPLLVSFAGGDDKARLTVLDVGQGLSVVFEKGENVLIYDAGPAYASSFDAGSMVVAPYLRSRGHRNIDVLIQSHGDLDHRGGMPALLESYPVGQAFGLEEGYPCRTGEAWTWPGVHFEFLHPDSSAWTGNNSSCVLKITLDSSEILLTGDIEKGAENALVTERAGELSSDILVVPHHGSNSSSSQLFLNAVNPDVALVSAGWRNRWGFPRPEVHERYQSLGAETYNTADGGALMLEFDESGQLTWIQGWRQVGKRFWHD